MKYYRFLNITITITIYLFIQPIILLADPKNEKILDLNQDWGACIENITKIDRLCGGCYLQPVLDQDPSFNLSKDRLIINSDHSKYIPKKGSIFTGNVVVTRQNQQITADQLVVEQNSSGKISLLQFKGITKLTQPDLRLMGNNLKITLVNANSQEMDNVNYRIYSKHATGDAKFIVINEHKNLNLTEATYTTCDPKDRSWEIKAKKISLNRATNRITANHATLYLRKAPIFYLPYISFSINQQKSTGFLLPKLVNSSKDGWSVNIPWYWSIADHYDYTFSPEYMSKRGIKINNLFRYLNKHTLGILSLNMLFKDRVATNLSNTPGIKSKRYAIGYKTLIDPDQYNWHIYVNYNKVSDSKYLQDFGKDLSKYIYSNTLFSMIKTPEQFYNIYADGSGLEEILNQASLHLERAIKVAYLNNYGIFNFNNISYQSLDPGSANIMEPQYRKTPEISWNSHPIQFLGNNFLYYNVNYTNFNLNNLADPKNPISIGKRLYCSSIIETSLVQHYGYINPRFKLHFVKYLDLQQKTTQGIYLAAKDQTRLVPIFDLKSGIRLERELGDSWQQRLEPKIYYTYIPTPQKQSIPNFDSKFIPYSYRQLFLDNPYSSLDQISVGHKITLGLDTSFYDLKTDQDRFSFGVARARYFNQQRSYFEENPTNNVWSPIVMHAKYNYNNIWSLQADLVMEKLSKVESSSINSLYKFGEESILKIGSQFVRTGKSMHQQLYGSGSVTLNDRVKFLGKIDYDLNLKKIALIFSGLELDSCCLKGRIGISRAIDPFLVSHSRFSHKFFAQIEFKGFTEIGNLSDNY